VDLDPDWESGSRIQGQKMKKNKYFFSWFFITEKYKNSTSLTFFVDFLIFEKICLLKSVVDPDPYPDPDWIRIQ
jgi:hypothetical protein